MNHDRAHCADYDPLRCPPECFQARLFNNLIMLIKVGRFSKDQLFDWTHMIDTEECMRDDIE